ncbi:MAG: hypothetical protein ABW168_01935 [Sedimenticola sp.]
MGNIIGLSGSLGVAVCPSPVEGRRKPIHGGLTAASLPQTPSTEEGQTALKLCVVDKQLTV